MTEREKAQAQLLYDANYDAEVLRERMACMEMIHDFNLLRPSDKDAQDAILRQLLGKTGEVFTILQPFYCDYGYNIEIGENFFMNYNCTVLDGAKVTFGDNVFIAPGCGFYCAGHPLDKERRNQGLEYAYPITVGNDVWIGGAVLVLPGVTIGSGAVIGSGSVVTKDIPENVVAVGNPCRVLRPITEEDKMGYINPPPARSR